MVKIQVKGQHMTAISCDKIVADSLNVLECHFSFSDDWEGMTKTAQFTQVKAGEDGTPESITFNVLIDGAGYADLPNELSPGAFCVSVFGVNDAQRLTTAPLSLFVHHSGFVGDGETPIPPTPDLYQQLLGEMAAALDGITREYVAGAVHDYLEDTTGYANVNLVPESYGPFTGEHDPAERITLTGDYRGDFVLSADITKEASDTATNTRLEIIVVYADETRQSFFGVMDANAAERDGITRRKTLQFTTKEGAAVRELQLLPMSYGSLGAAGKRYAKAERIKLERGIRATEWTPHPEDVPKSINAINQRLAGIELRLELLEEMAADE